MWTDKMTKRLLELKTQRDMYGQPSESQMAEILSEEFGVSLTKNSIHGRLWRLAEGKEARIEFPEFMPNYLRYSEYIHNNLIRNNPPDSFDLVGHKKILHMSDLHIPFQNNNAVGAALNLGASSDVLILSEILDFSSISHFNDGGAVPLWEEIEKGLMFLELVSPRFEHIFIVSGNHEMRVKRTLARQLPVELFNLMLDWDVIQLLARPFRNIYVIPNWWLELGKVIFCHANKTSAVSMKAGVEVNDYFLTNAAALGIRPYNILVQSHTHCMGVSYRGDVKVFESGCLCKVMPWYLAKPHKTVWATGFVTLELANGVPILNLCREHRLDPEVMLEKGLVL